LIIHSFHYADFEIKVRFFCQSEGNFVLLTVIKFFFLIKIKSLKNVQFKYILQTIMKMLSRTMSSNFYAEEIYLVQQKIKRQEVHNDLSYKRLYHILNNNEVPIDPHFSSISSLIFIFLLLQRVKKLLKFVFTI